MATFEAGSGDCIQYPDGSAEDLFDVEARGEVWSNDEVEFSALENVVRGVSMGPGLLRCWGGYLEDYY